MTNSVSIEDLKKQKRWTLWRLEPKDGKPGEFTKPPCSSKGFKHDITNPDNLKTYAELEPLAAKFSGMGFALGDFDGVAVWGVDIDKCCDRATRKFSPETRQVVIDLNTYGEYSPSGTGCHVVGLGKLPVAPGNKKEVLIRTFPGAKQLEIKGLGFYFTFTGGHLSKTPGELMDRQTEILALYDRVSKIPKATKEHDGLVLTVSLTEEERFQKLMAGDMSAYNDNHSVADFALCILLAKKYQCNAFKIDTEFRSSGLYRDDKWERVDYRENTITRAILAVAKDAPVICDDPEDELMEDDGVDEYLVNALTKDHEGWFPKGDVSLVGGSSGAGKTYWLMALLEKVRHGAEVWGHTTTQRDYRVLMVDRGTKAMRRTLNKLDLSAEAKQRVIRVTGKQHSAGPVAVMTEVTEHNPGAEAWFVEGLDLWMKEAAKMNEVSQTLDALQRLATRRNISIIASVGSPKEKTAEGRDTERYRGRDALFGSVAWGRKSETIVLISKTDNDTLHDDCPRQYSVLVRNGWSEHFWMAFKNGELQMVARPEPKEEQAKPPKRTAVQTMGLNCLFKFKRGERVVYSPDLGARATFYRWLDLAVESGELTCSDGNYYVAYADSPEGGRELDTETNTQRVSVST
jgi:hypothetical protein